VSTFSRIDVLISNAGICPFHTFLDLPASLWKRVQDVNLNGAFYTVQAVANQMAKQDSPKGGAIVAVSSISALMGGGEQCHYTPTKAGVKSLMESCAIALGPMGIRCNSVLPGESCRISNSPVPADRQGQSRRISTRRTYQTQ
jgi:L-rhamnose 1-dehydrogenase